MEIIFFIFNVFYFLLPAGISNMAPVLVKKINLFNTPVDFNLKINNKRIFGDHKTYRGFIFGVFFSIIIVYIQWIIYNNTSFDFFINYNNVNLFLLGFLLGFGALFGDLIKSFFKRRIGLRPGAGWFPFDQLDWVIGSLLFVSLYITIPYSFYIVSLLLFVFIHPLVNYLGYLLKIKKNKF